MFNRLLGLPPSVLICLVGMAAFLPFIDRPLFVDDHAHVRLAFDLMEHPGLPFPRHPGELGWQEGQNPTNAN
ncbi:hypothetical protein, partial [Mycobacterium tuberculosis]|uniref:hypothetical protein n=1 Tax=Mycobacterium tuberculosis TaxID=1773 RepID=UPI0025507972